MAAKRSTKTKAVTNEVLEMKKAEVRQEKAEKEVEAVLTQEPIEIVDDITEDGSLSVKEDAIEEIIEEEPPLPPKPLRSRALSAQEEAELIAELRTILKVPKTKDAIPVFSMYTIGDFNRRYFLLDVDGIAYRKAWNTFKERTGTVDSVKFLELVYQILNIDMPRLHRAVDWVPLT